MRTNFGLSPLFRSAIGFDRVFHLLENAGQSAQADNWPPYDIARTGENAYRITMAVAGFAEAELSITQDQNLLVVTGSKPEEPEREHLHHGIAGGPFEHRFELADYVRVAGAMLENGLLTNDLIRDLPEEMKPRRIAIGSSPSKQRFEGGKQAA